VIDTASQSKAEDVLSLLRKALEGFPALPIDTKIEFTHVMKAWVTIPNCHTDFVVGEECRIVDAEQKSSIINVKNFDVTSDTITENISQGMQVRSLALTYKDRLSFVLNSDFIIKRVKFLDLAMEERGEFDAGDELEKFFADMILMTGEFRVLLDDLVKVLGGYREQ
jgi:recombination associated protein RdgC